ncbi:hypothetical protein IU453_15475 [Nocardia cyriacigeorgica]|uniref:hypothetical protein n=1 Tax=Nocardia cyriacigeorgica TaxID=135487 RepID=UPI001893B094|nr:hypothetical protein [Nocardia cyriacigeorgica]MBF6318163.1 hypothetical protein [Nocardia cyriacigeorgica]MBF6345913.1 hypothetical protein [Nocardia cyriacigeorgica]MBF6532943.1 hypothetical protein [Nocardia cyriacigeorgica]
MDFSTAAGVGGLGFVVAAFVVNYFYLRAGLPTPGAPVGLDEVERRFAAGVEVLKRSSVVIPVTWLCTTVFAAGLLSVLWGGGGGQTAWALMGFAGVLMQNATFVVVEALRFSMAAGATAGGPTAGIWGFTNVLFGFNQVFLATALLGFGLAGSAAGFLPVWLSVFGYVSAALLFVSSTAAPFTVDGSSRLGPVGLIGWLGWAAWIVGCSIELLRW